jgi:hypothetical protein
MEDGEYTWLIMEYQQLHHFHYLLLFLVAILSLLLLLLSIKKKPPPQLRPSQQLIRSIPIHEVKYIAHKEREGNMHMGK